jgi:hypothetical protein
MLPLYAQELITTGLTAKEIIASKALIFGIYNEAQSCKTARRIVLVQKLNIALMITDFLDIYGN